MRKHPRGPKDRYVKKYPRWVRGERQRVRDHRKGGETPKAKKRNDDAQGSLDL